MLIFHPHIYLNAAGDTTDALLVRQGRVVATGDDARAGATSRDPVLRPDGACLFPALGEAHIHLWGLGLRSGSVDLRGLHAGALLDTLQDQSPGPSGWIFGHNWDEHHFQPDRPLTLARLDALFPDTPVCLRRVDGHALWVNTAALNQTDFLSRYHPTPGGLVERAPDGTLTGRLVDAAMEPLLERVPHPTEAEDRLVCKRTLSTLRSHGVAFCTLAFCPTDRVSMLTSLARDADTDVFVDALVDAEDRDLETFLDRTTPGLVVPGASGLRVGGIKFFADGAMGSAGAHLLEDYRTGGRGLRLYEEGALKRRIPALMKRGWQVAVHAIGDAAAREVLDAFAAAPASLREALRPRLEHAQIVAPDDAPRFAALQVIASIQPIHLRSDAPWAARRLHPHQLDRLFAYRRLLPAVLAGGSDYPIDDINPWHGIATAVSRQGADGVPFRPEEALTVSEALQAYTEGAAFAAHLEEDFGSLTPGHRAAIIALSDDPFSSSPQKIWDMQAHRLPVTPTT